MENEMRLVDANRYKKTLENSLEGTYGIEDPKIASVMAGTFIACRVLIDEIPTIDAVEVVRCKDCKFSAQADPYDPMECNKWHTKFGVVYTDPDGYCHKGERKDNAR